jgi:hypothetical protein
MVVIIHIKMSRKVDRRKNIMEANRILLGENIIKEEKKTCKCDKCDCNGECKETCTCDCCK